MSDDLSERLPPHEPYWQRDIDIGPVTVAGRLIPAALRVHTGLQAAPREELAESGLAHVQERTLMWVQARPFLRGLSTERPLTGNGAQELPQSHRSPRASVPGLRHGMMRATVIGTLYQSRFILPYIRGRDTCGVEGAYINAPATRIPANAAPSGGSGIRRVKGAPPMSPKRAVLLALLLPLGLLLQSAPASAQSATSHLSTALQEQMQVARIIGDPAIDGEPAAIQQAVQQAKPHAMTVKMELQATLPLVSGMTQQLVQDALDQLESALQLGELILMGPAEHIVRYHKEMQAHSSVTIQGIGGALRTLEAGPLVSVMGRELAATDLHLPPGYRAEIVVRGLSFATVVAVAEDGTVYVAEAGFSYPGVEAPPRVLRVRPDGTTEVVVNRGLNGPVAGLAVHRGMLYIAHRGTVSAVDLATGAMRDLVTGLPALGDHFTENLAVGPDGKLYFTQGTATNSAVVGLDNYVVYWLRLHPQFSDVPCRDYTLNGRNYTTGNPLTEDVTDTATTGPFMPFGTAVQPGQIVRGQVKCNGAVLRMNLDGSGLEVFADGFRNPYGLAFHPDGRLFVTENGPDDRGSRPVTGPDNLYEVIQGGWYGWPDFYSFIPVESLLLKPETGPVSEPVLVDPPPLATPPLARFAPHSSSDGLDFSRSAAFAPVGTAFIAQFGDLTPATAGGVREHAGHQVVTVTPEGDVQPFLTSAVGQDEDGRPLLRATDATFDPSGQVLYVTHFGEFSTARGVLAPTVGTGALIRITRGAPAGQPAAPPAQRPR